MKSKLKMDDICIYTPNQYQCSDEGPAYFSAVKKDKHLVNTRVLITCIPKETNFLHKTWVEGRFINGPNAGVVGFFHVKALKLILYKNISINPWNKPEV